MLNILKRKSLSNGKYVQLCFIAIPSFSFLPNIREKPNMSLTIQTNTRHVSNNLDWCLSFLLNFIRALYRFKNKKYLYKTDDTAHS